MATILNKPAATQGEFSLGRLIAWRRVLLTLWVMATALFMARAITGFFTRSLPSLALIAVALVAVVIAMEIRLALRGGSYIEPRSPHSTVSWLEQLLPSLGLLFLAVGFTVAGAHVTGLVLLWMLVAVELAFGAAGPWSMPIAGRWLNRDKLVREQTDSNDVLSQQDKTDLLRSDPAPLVRAAREPEAPTEPAAQAIVADKNGTEETEELPWLWQESTARQELRYIDLPAGGYCVTGSQRVALPAQQQTVIVHTVFYPPFEVTPIVTIEMQEPDDVTIKAAQVLPHGIRWELRATAVENEREVRWAFSATTTRDSRR